MRCPHIACQLASLLVIFGCGTTDVAPPAVTTAPSAPEPWVEWLLAADARPDALELAGRTAFTRLGRRARSLALARLGDPAAVPALVAGLRDPDPAVRNASAMGLGALESEAPDAAVIAMVGALAAESDTDLRASLLGDLGRTGDPAAWPALTDGLAADSATVRRGACRGVGAVGLLGVEMPEPTLLRAATRTADDPDAGVRMLCAHALGRAVSVPASAVADLSRAAVDPDASVRALALRALGRHPATPLSVLVTGASDPDRFVALAGLRALSSRPDAAPPYAERLEALVEAYFAHPEAWTQVLLAALEAPSPALAATPELSAASARIADRLATVAPGSSADRDRGLLHCAAVRLVELAGGTPPRVEECGLGHVSDAERRALLADLLGATTPPTAPVPTRLEALALDPSERVREAVCSSLSGRTHSSATAVLRGLLADPDSGVRIAAVEAIGVSLARERAARDESALELLLGGSVPTAVPVVLDDGLRGALRAVLESFAETDDLEGLVTTASAIEAARDGELAGHLAPLVAHHNVTVRRRARAALEACDLDETTLAAAPRAAPPAPRTERDLALDARLARVVTARGTLLIELWPEVAPTTVARFVELAEAQVFDGLSFHRVVPGFVVQAGDPRGDGYGGPGWSQRCEDNRAHYERGTVGMALAGRDTGGSQFFVTLTPQPHLDGRYTAFGRVTEGMEVVDRLGRGDTITSVRIERGTPAREPRLAPE